MPCNPTTLKRSQKPRSWAKRWCSGKRRWTRSGFPSCCSPSSALKSDSTCQKTHHGGDLRSGRLRGVVLSDQILVGLQDKIQLYICLLLERKLHYDATHCFLCLDCDHSRPHGFLTGDNLSQGQMVISVLQQVLPASLLSNCN